MAIATSARRVSGRPAGTDILDLSIVVPVFNEVESVGQLHAALTAVLEPLPLDYEIIVVDDGSTDGTSAELAAMAERDPRLKVIEFRRNFGQTAAIAAGFDYALGAVVIPVTTA